VGNFGEENQSKTGPFGQARGVGKKEAKIKMK
jgi:hypothetical protein